MNKIKDLYTTFEKVTSNVKFAVVIISIFTVALIYGTFMESYHGADYAKRLIYLSWWFIALQVMMFISIFMAVVVRLPMKKRLYGFYTIHAGLIILFIGSFFTYKNGIDGSIQLLPKTPTNKILINEDVLQVHQEIDNKLYRVKLPYTATETTVNADLGLSKVKKFIPFAENRVKWTKNEKHQKSEHSSQYILFNEMLSQEFTLSLSPQSDFKSNERMGLLNLHYMPEILLNCFMKESATDLILWNIFNGDCFTPEEKGISVEMTPNNTRFLAFKHKGETLTFFPDFSPIAVDEKMNKKEDTEYRVMSKQVFTKQNSNNLFLFGEHAVFYSKGRKKWIKKSLKDNKLAKLPWMNFQLRLLKHERGLFPIEEPYSVIPIQDNNEIIKGGIKAVQIEFNNELYWVRSDRPLKLSNGEKNINFQLINKEIKLPYQITLEKFKMNKNPGTNDPASYESFVSLLDGRSNIGAKEHHVFMNNPLKYDDFTFYQSSYFPLGIDEKGENVFGSVFSVNYDPGRFFKYFASLLIVLGSAWHYILNRKRKKKVNV